MARIGMGMGMIGRKGRQASLVHQVGWLALYICVNHRWDVGGWMDALKGARGKEHHGLDQIDNDVEHELNELMKQ